MILLEGVVSVRMVADSLLAKLCRSYYFFLLLSVDDSLLDVSKTNLCCQKFSEMPQICVYLSGFVCGFELPFLVGGHKGMCQWGEKRHKKAHYVFYVHTAA